MGSPWARREPVVDEVCGRRVDDPYRWLETEDAACTAWLADQERWLADHQRAWQESQEAFQALLQRFAGAGSAAAPAAVPVVRDGCRFFLRCPAGRELPVLMAAAADGDRRVVVDPLELDGSGRTALAHWRPSWSGRLVAFQVVAGGSEAPVLRVAESAGGRGIGPVLHPGRVTPVAWLAGDEGFYYVTCPRDGARQVRLHRFAHGGTGTDDAVVFQTAFRQLSVSTSADGRWAAVNCAPGSQAGNQLYVADLRAGPPQAPAWRLVHDGTTTGTQAAVKFGPGGLLYAITTERAPGARICRIDPDHPDAESWTPLVTPGHDTVLSACAVLTDPRDRSVRLLVSSARHGVAALSLHDDAGRPLADIDTPGTGPGTIRKLTAPPGESDEAWFLHTDFLTPPTVYRFSLHDRRCHTDHGPVAPGKAQAADPAVSVGAPHTPLPPASPTAADASPSRAPAEPSPQPPMPSVRQLTYPADDGTPIPLFLITPPGHDHRHGPRPALLTAYGGFGAIAAPTYSPTILAWVAAGGIYAIAGVRGGGEQGTAWHRAGSGTNKPTAIADYTAAARWLTRHGWTSPAQLAIKGGSHSGLMVAAAVSQSPELYAAAVCSGALTDMIRYPDLGIGQWWIKEFGDPTDPEHLDVLLSYSPYHRIRPGTPYPAVLMITGRTDNRVGPSHTRKFTAALQHATTSGKPVLLRCHDGGHAPPTPSQLITVEAEALAFCAAHTRLRH